MLSYNLKQVMVARGIDRPHRFLVKAGFSRHTASRLLDQRCQKIFAEHVDLLCAALVCTPNDLFVWVPDKGVIYPDDYPMKALVQQDLGEGLMSALASMPLEKFKEVAKLVLEREKESEGDG